MKPAIIKILLFVLLLPLCADAQIHPVTYGAGPGGVYRDNWYKDYVGMLFDVTAPASLVGSKEYTAANTDGTGWGGTIAAPLTNRQIIMPPGDSLVTMPVTVSMTGKIALVYRGGGIEFSAKALAVQTAGAIACVIVNNVPGAPVGMSAGAVGGSVTIPVFMISKADGDAMDAAYLAGTTITMTIALWGRGHTNDLGFVPQGLAGWSNYATPANQLFPSVTDVAYKAMSGAFIANYGTSTATNVKLRDTMRYFPTVGAPSIVHTGVSANLASFPAADSIYAMTGTAEYSFAPPAAGTGRFDIKYNIVADGTDAYPADNSATLSFYTTDSVYSKGKYDFVNRKPVTPVYNAVGSGTSFLWGPMYYVARGGSSISSVQFSVAENAPGPIFTSPTVAAYAFKWVDGFGGMPLDGYTQDDELTMVAMGVYSFIPTDSSGDVFKVNMYDPSSGTGIVLLDAASWYYVAIDVPGGMFLGTDPSTSAYPRIYARSHVSGYVDNSGRVTPGGVFDLGIDPFRATAPLPFPNTYFVNSIDSFNYRINKGMTPGVAMIVNNAPTFPIVGSNPICMGDAPTYTNALAGGTWSSSTPAVATISAATGALTTLSAGTTTISYTTPAGGVSILILTVNGVPAPPISGPATVCIGSTITLTSTTSGGTWSTSGTYATVSSSGVVSGIAEGMDNITYSASNSCGTGFTFVPVTVAPLPVPVIVVTGPTLSTTTSYTTYQWLYSGSAIGGATSATYDALLDGAYAVTVTDANGCTATSMVAIVALVGVHDVTLSKRGINIFPNPTSGAMTLQTKVAGRLTVYAIDGRAVANYTATAGNTILQLPSDIAAGVYMCRFVGDNGTSAMVRLVYEK